MSPSLYRQRVMAALEALGIPCRVTGKGHLFINGPKGTCTISGTPGDWRAWRNVVTQLKRAGVVLPDDVLK